MATQDHKSNRSGFTLIEVVLALGVFLISVLALIGLLSPMLQSVDEVEKIDEITSVVNTVNAFLQSSPKIAVRNNGAVTQTKFDGIYRAIREGNNEATVFVFRYYDDDSRDSIRLEVGFSPNENAEDDFVGTASIVDEDLFREAAGPIYRVVLTASSVTPVAPEQLRSTSRVNGIYTLSEDLANYPEGYLAMEARIFAEDPPGPSAQFDFETNLAELAEREPDFTFNTAIVR